MRPPDVLDEQGQPIGLACEDRRCPAFGRVHKDDAELIACAEIVHDASDCADRGCWCACHRTGPRSPGCADCAHRHDVEPVSILGELGDPQGSLDFHGRDARDQRRGL